ncbi:hypothetical protein B0O99DRAFT_588053 [Bisporella sp. PMI_857]|nr:hypothetical protein B0O99DRAFT_588053 [Bisporella sp. PMI_857]
MATRGYNSLYGFDVGGPPPGLGGTSQLGISSQLRGLCRLQSNTYQPNLYQPNIYHSRLPSTQLPVQPYPHFGFPGLYGMPPFPGGPRQNLKREVGVADVNFKNETGGVGMPPGYNYLFPAEHCKVHVLKTKIPPWQLSLHYGQLNDIEYGRYIIPANVTVKELMQQFGCTADAPNKNHVHEIQEAGDGKWIKGMSIHGGQKDRVDKSIRDMGWDGTRTGWPGQRPVVWLWFVKDK